MDWKTVVALASLALTALTVYLSYKKRADPYKERVYSKQLEIYGELADGLSEFAFVSLPLLIEQDFCIDDNSRLLLEKQTEEFYRNWVSWSLFLPMEVNSAVVDLVWTISAVIAPRDELPQLPRQDIVAKMAGADDPLSTIADAWTNVFFTANICLGIEPLSRETTSLARGMPWTLIQARLQRSSFRRRG